MESTYGMEIELSNDPHIARSDLGIIHFDNTVVHGTFLVDIFPFLQYIPRWFPGAGFRRYADEARRDTTSMINIPYNEAVTLHNEGKTSIVSRSLSRAATASETATRLVRDVAAVACAAGVDTTQSPLLAFFAAMALFPDVQRKAQEEVDSLLGGGPNARLPTFADLPSLPYTQAVVWELLRWQPALPLGFPHLSTTEDVYNGYQLPKGSIITFNFWTITRSPENFPDPERFIPERFISECGQLNKELIEIVELGFGFARRKCPGRYFAWDSIWIYMVSTLCVFDIRPTKDKFGQDIVPEVELKPILLTKLKPFKCAVTPRSKHFSKLIEDEEVY